MSHCRDGIALFIVDQMIEMTICGPLAKEGFEALIRLWMLSMGWFFQQPILRHERDCPLDGFCRGFELPYEQLL
jgi:hypothetical protein